ncbi:murein hydrolase activator EnvC family protein [Cesiribacter andamanensis]|uniref:Septal ring factor n=1 Tax=Cesiribacter andamanensis AMV16 TaxID=1279009 RepID=M7NS62_9BACT|nr:peptidoglycan DD-metalloendopeptidase family protein [Cesiribacter andamanensis]EMR04540.1 Septal ring factor [Cesiribacter andamanensis AMV16]
MFANTRGVGLWGIVLLCLLVAPAVAQNKAELEKKKQENLKKIREAENILSQTRNEKKATLGELSALEAQIAASQELTRLISKELSLLDAEIGELGLVVRALEKDLSQFKQEYAKMVYNAYKANKGYSTLTFLFSAPTFNQLFMRMKWLEQYKEARIVQLEQIRKVQDLLGMQQQQVRSKRQEQQKLLDEQVAQNQNLIALQQRQSRTIARLSEQEKSIQQDLNQRRKDLQQLDALLARLVKEEIERARKEAEAEARRNKTATASASAAVPLTPEAAALGNSFEGARARLLWPVASGFISAQFGEQQVYKQVKLENSGIEIQTKENEQVRAVFDGEVRRVFFMPGMNNVVMIQHGQYFTVYARLKEVTVKPLQKIKAKDPIGTVYTTKEGVSEVHFEIWKNDQKLNPEQWLFKN